MFGEQLADLDELILRCKDEKARQYIAEAVACYRVGAFRACIVATWVAVLFDFLNKLQQLELTGDRNAAQLLQTFEQARLQSDHKPTLLFEREVLTKACNDFEFISPIEYDDLKRLQEDRNRCAHPSMNARDEVYKPTAELARCHLRNAVTHMLQHPPVQGRAALSRLMDDVASAYFPPTLDEALEYLRHGPLARPRESLIRDFVLVLAKALLLQEQDTEAVRHYAAALNAVRILHRDSVEKILSNKLSDLVRQVTDTRLAKVLIFLQEIADSWDFLQADTQGEIRRYVRNMPTADLSIALIPALSVTPLHDMALERLDGVAEKELTGLLMHGQQPEFVERAVTFYEHAQSPEQANQCAYDLLVPLLPHLQLDHIARIVKAGARTKQVSSTWGFRWIIRQLPLTGTVTAAALIELLQNHGIDVPPEKKGRGTKSAPVSSNSSSNSDPAPATNTFPPDVQVDISS